MKRRTLIATLGGLAAGGTTIFGTGAFTAAQVSRDVNIQVVSDADALLGMTPNPDVAGVTLDDGQMTIDITDPGINQNAVYQFGYFADGSDMNTMSAEFPGYPLEQPEPSDRENGGNFGSAFLLSNQAGGTYDCTMEYSVTGVDTGVTDTVDTKVWFEAHQDGDRKQLLKGPTEEEQRSTIEFDPGETIGVSFLLWAPEQTRGEQLTGSLRITASPQS